MHPLVHKLLGKKLKDSDELIKEQIKLTTSITCLPIGFVIIDPKEAVLTINPAAQLIIGSLVVPTQLEHIPKALQDALRTYCEETAKTQRVVSKDNFVYGEKFIKLYFAPIVAHSYNSEYLGTVIVMEDVTEARVLERSRDEFFSIASHELRTPLTAIRGNTSMILDMYSEQLNDPELVTMLGDIYQSSIRLIGIVNDFLNMSRVEQGKIEYKKETFDLVEMSQEVCQELATVNTNSKVSLGVTPPQEPLQSVRADKNRSKEILINLVGNALKFTETGSVSLAFRKDGASVVLLVTDTGRGLSPENQHILFHKFQQASDSILARDTTKSTGLGLYISKLMIEGMGGKIWLESSELGVGSTFAIALPTE